MGRTGTCIHDRRDSGQVLTAQTGATLSNLMAWLGQSSVNTDMKITHASGDHAR
jgi:hypothetical protein